MLSRSRKYRKSFDNYEQAIEKQLNDDFQVNEYIEQNKLEAYLLSYLATWKSTWNSLTVSKWQRIKRKKSLILFRSLTRKWTPKNYKKPLSPLKSKTGAALKKNLLILTNKCKSRPSMKSKSKIISGRKSSKPKSPW